MEELTVVMPAYNESRRIARSLEEIKHYLSGRGTRFELIVVDDGSVDDTAYLVESLSARLPELRVLKLRHQGKGAAVKAGMLDAKGRLILMCDADLSTPITELKKLEAALKQGADLAVGSRRAAGAVLARRQPWLREAVGVVFGFFTRLLIPTGIIDTQCGFKLFPAEVARKLFPLLTVKGFTFDIELLALARKLGLRVAEVPVVWEDAEGSKVKPLRHLPEVISEIWRIRLGLWRRKDLGRS
jgi:dolichyl-phosphate beta-glucosyltransferase